MADCFYDTDQQQRAPYRASAYGSALKRSSRRDSVDSDFSSMYTAKSGTPLMYKMGIVSENISNDFSMSLTPRTRTTMAWDSISREDIGEDNTAFCKKYNMRQCLISLSQEMCSLGLQSLFNGDSETVDIVRFINNAYILVKEQQSICKQQTDQYEVKKKLEADVDQLSQLNSRLKAELDDSERQSARLELTVQQLRGNIRDLTDKLKTEKDEVRRLDCVMHSREAQYKHESRKKEQELDKMKERMHRLITDKTNKKIAGLQLSAVAEKANRTDMDWYRSVVGAYEEHEKVLMAENIDLKQGLFDIQRELSSVLTFAGSKNGSCEENAVQDIDDINSILNSTMQSTSDQLSQAYHEMPYSVISDEIRTSLKEKCQLIKDLVKNGSNETERVEQWKLKLQEYDSAVEQHRQIVFQSLQPVSDVTDVSFLIETNHLDEKDETSTKESWFQQQRLQLEDEHQKLVDYALELAKQRDAVEQMKMEVLHKEFMLLTPFRNSKSQNSHAVQTSPNGSNENCSRRQSIASDLPSTAELLRQFGLVNTSVDNRNFMSETRSAIREGLCDSTADINEPFDKVKTVLFNHSDDPDVVTVT